MLPLAYLATSIASSYVLTLFLTVSICLQKYLNLSFQGIYKRVWLHNHKKVPNICTFHFQPVDPRGKKGIGASHPCSVSHAPQLAADPFGISIGTVWSDMWGGSV